ncbi:hypothetical protein [Pseudogracilibacillus sp. SO30301A]|uniref:hypothetical protein n=1 Tax=Pseudogracilibacillus sp. SO30301A TaxID=3098291 RepID=UPI00300E2237
MKANGAIMHLLDMLFLEIGYNDDQIRQLVLAIYSEFDIKSVPEEEDIYRESGLLRGGKI